MEQNHHNQPLISVVIPAMNEEHNLPHVLPFIPLTVHEVILVDGNSTDNTITAAQELWPSIRIVKQAGKGKGAALRQGFEASTGDIIVMLDADGSANPREIPRFVDSLLKGYDFAKGSRFMRGGGSHDITFVRTTGNFLLSRFVNLLYWTNFTDLCYGYNVFWKYCLNYINVDTDGFEVETLISLRILRAKLKIIEIPSFEYPRVHGASNLNTFRDGWRVLKTILKERVREVPHALQVHHFASLPKTTDQLPVTKLPVEPTTDALATPPLLLEPAKQSHLERVRSTK
ncbi:MAG TPA: glycosyltransferase family 2 protein [Ktedonosporobacter sp.]|nr:glycosyltransferase family 2 protein [Ktedonosporobacter sp.]